MAPEERDHAKRRGMAKLGEGDARWIVKDRPDGQNVNGWHWTTKDTSDHVKACLSAGLQRSIFPKSSPLANCRITDVKAAGEASVNSRTSLREAGAKREQ